MLDSSVRRSASSPYTSRSGSALKRRIVVVTLVVLSLTLITASFRESSGGRLHGVENAGATALRPFEVATDRVARPFRDAYNWFHGLATARSENQKLRRQVQEYRQKYAAAESASASRHRSTTWSPVACFGVRCRRHVNSDPRH